MEVILQGVITRLRSGRDHTLTVHLDAPGSRCTWFVPCLPPASTDGGHVVLVVCGLLQLPGRQVSAASFRN